MRVDPGSHGQDSVMRVDLGSHGQGSVMRVVLGLHGLGWRLDRESDSDIVFEVKNCDMAVFSALKERAT